MYKLRTGFSLDKTGLIVGQMGTIVIKFTRGVSTPQMFVCLFPAQTGEMVVKGFAVSAIFRFRLCL
jgi:hypothetical protein